MPAARLSYMSTRSVLWPTLPVPPHAHSQQSALSSQDASRVPSRGPVESSPDLRLTTLTIIVIDNVAEDAACTLRLRRHAGSRQRDCIINGVSSRARQCLLCCGFRMPTLSLNLYQKQIVLQ